MVSEEPLEFSFDDANSYHSQQLIIDDLTGMPFTRMNKGTFEEYFINFHKLFNELNELDMKILSLSLDEEEYERVKHSTDNMDINTMIESINTIHNVNQEEANFGAFMESMYEKYNVDSDTDFNDIPIEMLEEIYEMLLTRFPNAVNVQKDFKELLDARIENKAKPDIEHKFTRNFKLISSENVVEFNNLLELYDELINQLHSMLIINGICEEINDQIFRYFQECFKPLVSETVKISKADLDEYKHLLWTSIKSISTSP